MTTEIHNSEFIQKLYKIVKLENKVERARKQLNKRSDFDPLLLFSFFDKYVWCPKYSYDKSGPSEIAFESKQYLDIRKLKSRYQQSY